MKTYMSNISTITKHPAKSHPSPLIVDVGEVSPRESTGAIRRSISTDSSITVLGAVLGNIIKNNIFRE